MVEILKVDGARLWETLDASAAIGTNEKGGLRRLALTDTDRDMRDLFVHWCRDAGCDVSIDCVGNIFARRPGTRSDLSPVMMGSHLDTQIAGGRFDGILGVLAGLEVIRTLNDYGIRTRRPVEVVCWTNEEGVRFQPPMMGSGAFAGKHDVEWVLDQRDEVGIRLGDELTRIGYAGPSQRAPSDIDSYFELHIEQGPVLHEEGLEVGIVTGGYTSYGAKILFTGETAHSGSAPMRARHDALVAAANIISRANEVGWQYEPNGRASCARLDISPNRYGIVSDKAEVTVDVRHPDAAAAAEMYQAILDAVPAAAQQGGVHASLTKEWKFGDMAFDPALINLVRRIASDLGVSHRHMLSAAGHDAYQMSSVTQSIMIFVQCREGISHNEREHIEMANTVPGVDVLLNSVLERAGREES